MAEPQLIWLVIYTAHDMNSRGSNIRYDRASRNLDDAKNYVHAAFGVDLVRTPRPGQQDDKDYVERESFSDMTGTQDGRDSQVTITDVDLY